MKPSRIKPMLERGEPVIVPNVDRILSPRMIEILGMLGYDCVWLDMEHGHMSYERLGEMAAAARVSGMDIILRIAKGGYSNVIRPLELGVNALVLPHCMSAREAREFASMAKFHPMGRRGVGQGIDWRYGLMEFNDFIRQANEQTVLIAQIEDREAIEDIDAIAAVENIDGLFLGPCDLSMSYGVPGETAHPLIRDAIGKIAQAAKRHHKWWGLPAAPGEDMREKLKMGARFINPVQEVGVFIRGFRQALDLSKADFDACGLSRQGCHDDPGK